MFPSASGYEFASHPILHSDPCTWDSQAWIFPIARTKITPWEVPSGPNLSQIACWAMQVTLRPSHNRSPLHIHWLSCFSKPSVGLAPAFWDGYPCACMAFCSRCASLWPQACGGNAEVLHIGAQIYVQVRPWLWSCVLRYRNNHRLWMFGMKCSPPPVSFLGCPASIFLPSSPVIQVR